MESGAVSNSGSRLQWEVFLSFRGEDTRNTFTARLYDELTKYVRVFRDNEGMKRGHEIAPSLSEGIKNSASSVIVLSPRYADSHWCLDELAPLCDLRSSLGRRMLPIFYMVNPSHVRKQSHHFAKDFNDLSKKHTKDDIQRWRRAMNVVGNLSGFVFKEESDMDHKVSLVVKRVLAELINKPEEVRAYTVGLEFHLEELMKLLDFNSSSDVQVLGLYGMAGIGKTTLARAFYNKIAENFDQRVFMSNVRERSSNQDGLVNLQRTFINQLFHRLPQIDDVNSGRDTIRESVYEKKILAVLDDVDNVDQVDALVRKRGWYGEGSLIIITTRDETILSKLPVNQRFEVKCLTEMEALNLFSYHSLRREKPTETQLKTLELNEKIFKITRRLPLAIEVFGSLLYDKEEKEWQVLLDKLERDQPNNLQNVLLESYNSLDNEEKQVFLDIACLFLRMEITKEEVVDILKGCGFNAELTLSVLRQKSLVKIMGDGTLWMHDQVRDMGREIICKKTTMGRRLSDHAEIMAVLKSMEGMTSIRGIVFNFKKFVRGSSADEVDLLNLQDNPDINSVCNYLWNKFIRFRAGKMPNSSEISLRVEPFASMNKLRLLQINNVKLEGDLKLLPSELKWIQWKGCPLIQLPLGILPRQLAVLDLSDSAIRRVQGLDSNEVNENLKVINLRGCHNLEEIPDLSTLKALVKLVLEGCNLLVKAHRSVGNMNTLLHLNLRNCSKLVELPEDVSGLKKLENLILSGCSNLSVLPANIGDMRCLKELLLDETAIEQLPKSIFSLQNLVKLSLKGCKSVKQLPRCLGTLISLEELYLDGTALTDIPSSIGRLRKLRKLHLKQCTSLSKIPEAINELIALKELFINGSMVKELPIKPDSLPYLTDFSVGECKSLQQVPSSICRINSLLQLQLDSTPIKHLPKRIGKLHFIRKLELRNCMSLHFLPKSIRHMDTLRSLHLDGSNIEKLPKDFGKLENLELLQMNKCKKLQRLPESFGNLKSLHRLYMEETSVTELPENFGNLSNLRVLKMLKKPLFRELNKCLKNNAPGTSDELQFMKLPNSFSNLLLLQELDARGCRLSGKISDDFEKLFSMEILDLGNNLFHSLPSSLEGLSNLKKLSMCDCQELKCLPPLPLKLEQLNLTNCFGLETVSNLSKLKILHDLNLTNCEKVVDIPGLQHLTALKRLYLSGCNSHCYLSVKKILSQDFLRKLQNLSLPGSRIPDWFSQRPVMFSVQPNKVLRGIILVVVVALSHEIGEEDQLPDAVEIQAQITKVDRVVHTHTLNLCTVPRTNIDQLHICRYPVFLPIVSILKDEYKVQVLKPFKQSVELKMYGIHLVYEGDNDYEGDEHLLTETQITFSLKLASFFSSLDKGNAIGS